MSKFNPLDLISGDTQIGALPEIYSRLQRAMNDPLSSPEDIAAIIQQDVGITARLLRVVNSAFFALPVRVATVAHAVSIMGTGQLRDLVLSTLVIDKFRDIPGKLINMRKFWEHSITCALAAKAMATQKGLANAECFFTAGLLHDVGRILICQKLPQQAKEILEKCDAMRYGLLHRVEQEVLGFDHTRLGFLLLQQWRLPEFYQEVTLHHHAPLRASNFKMETVMINVAEIIANEFAASDISEAAFADPDAIARELSAMKDDSYFAAVREVSFHRDEAIALFT